MREHPDSAMSVLLSIDKNKLDNDEEKARHALLMSMALDKNYIDTTTFDVLRQAIDYYLKEGSPDDRLRTLYYQGRIFQNKGENDSAMKCFIKAEDLQDKCTDIITFANMLVAQGKIYFQSYQIEDYTLNNLRAAKLYHKLGKLNSQQSSLIRALDGCIASEDKHKADSLMEIIDSLVAIVPESQNMHTLVNLTYDIGIGSKEHINGLIDSISKLTPLDDETKLNISLGYLRLNEPEKANDIFSLIDTCSQIGQSIRYLSIKPDILEANKKYPEALQAFREYHNASETENSRIYLQKTAVAQELHRLEINYLNSLQHKDTIIWLVVCVILVLIQIIGVIYYQLRLGKKNQIMKLSKLI
ncbi:MAG: hypothetical protein K1W02_12985 [Muribaculaceae bacterium]|jgi:hypothetical protein